MNMARMRMLPNLSCSKKLEASRINFVNNLVYLKKGKKCRNDNFAEVKKGTWQFDKYGENGNVVKLFVM